MGGNITIKDPEINALVDEQTTAFNESASVEVKEGILKRLQKRQKKLMKGKEKDE